MADNSKRHVLVTGANSGLGFEAAAQFAEEGFGRVTITARSSEKAEQAQLELVSRTGSEVFATLTLDNHLLDTVDSAADVLIERSHSIDVLVLNAGIAPTPHVAYTPDGLEATVAATLTGHHRLTKRLLDAGLLENDAHIVIAGSEAARGDVPMMNPMDMHTFAADHFDGDLEAAIEAQIRLQTPARYKSGDVYATTKMFAAWWAAELADRVPASTVVTAVSPGSAPDTNAVRSAPLYMRRVMIPLFKAMPARMGMAGTVGEGANRYLQAADFGPEASGKFYASKPRRMTGELVEVDLPHLQDNEGRKALWAVTERMTRGAGQPSAV